MASIISDIEAQGVALTGNPGAGKSTILNGIAGKSVFKAGISLGRGLTSVLQTYVCEDGKLRLFDAPGLADVERRKQAGQEIDKMLQTRMSIKLAFVVTLEKGRVRPDDAATIKLVLEAIKSVDVQNRFGVIINQLSPSVLKMLSEDVDKAARVHNSITGSYQTPHWIYLPKMQELEDANDSKLMTPELVEFLCGLPHTKPPDAEVEEIDTRDLEERIQEQRQRILELEAANEQQRAEMRREFELYKKEAKAQAVEVRRYMAALEAQLKEQQKKTEMEKYKLHRFATGIWNTFALTGGAVTSVVLSNPAPMIAAGALCRTVRRPNNN